MLCKSNYCVTLFVDRAIEKKPKRSIESIDLDIVMSRLGSIKLINR